MERNRKTRMVAVTSMLIAVVFLTVAYALFSKNLNIQNMSATVKGNEANFSVKFSKSATKLDESLITPDETNRETALNVQIDNSGPNPKLTNLGFNVSSSVYHSDNEVAYYGFYIINDGGIDAYLKSIQMANAVGYDKPIVCIASEGTSQKLVDEACKSIYIIFQIESKGIEVTTEGIKHGDKYLFNSESGNYLGITGEKLLKNFGSAHSASIRIQSENVDNLTMAIDGSYEVKFGDITVEYSSQDT